MPCTSNPSIWAPEVVVAGKRDAIVLFARVINKDFIVPAEAYNALSVGPVYVHPDATVTVQPGGIWKII